MPTAGRKKRLFLLLGVLAAVVIFVLLILKVAVPKAKDRDPNYGRTSDASSFSISSVGFAGLHDLLSKAGGPEVKRLYYQSEESINDLFIIQDIYYYGSPLWQIIQDAEAEAKEAKAPEAEAREAEQGTGDSQGAAPEAAATEAVATEAVKDKGDKANRKFKALVFEDKWDYYDHPKVRGWVSDQELTNFEYYGSIVHNVSTETFFPKLLPKPWPKAESFYSVAGLPAPSGTDSIVLFCNNDDNGVETIVGAEGNLLVGRVETPTSVIYFISDPDVANNQGLGKGRNAAFIIGLIKYILAREGLSGVAFHEPSLRDNTLERLYSEPYFGPLLEFPLIIVTNLAVLAALIFSAALGWTFGGVGRLPGGIGLGQAAHGFGKLKLIDNSSRLMARPNLLPAVLAAYQKMTVQLAEKTVHVPRHPGESEAGWLKRMAKTKGLRPGSLGGQSVGQYDLGLEPLSREQSGVAAGKVRLIGTSEEKLISSALKLYEFRKELESGSSHPGRSGQ
ncbi:MAG: hypothetical protein LBJ61_01370 [Deltaproteobacteria bacterium]|nr:hypothetical protein [Deltaproteobacteria bacterium]